MWRDKESYSRWFLERIIQFFFWIVLILFTSLLPSGRYLEPCPSSCTTVRIQKKNGVYWDSTSPSSVAIFVMESPSDGRDRLPVPFCVGSVFLVKPFIYELRIGLRWFFDIDFGVGTVVFYSFFTSEGRGDPSFLRGVLRDGAGKGRSHHIIFLLIVSFEFILSWRVRCFGCKGQKLFFSE